MKSECTPTKALPPAVAQQVAVIDQSLDYIALVIVALVLTYIATSTQKKQLICSVTKDSDCACLPNTFPLQVISSVIVLAALIFFYQLAKQSEETEDSKSHCFNFVSSVFVLVAGILRLMNLICVA